MSAIIEGLWISLFVYFLFFIMIWICNELFMSGKLVTTGGRLVIVVGSLSFVSDQVVATPVNVFWDVHS